MNINECPEDLYIDGFMVQVEKTDYGIAIVIVDHDTLETVGFWEDGELKAYSEDLERNKTKEKRI